MKKPASRRLTALVPLCTAMLLASPAEAESLQQSFSLSRENIRQEQLTQRRIDQLSEQTQAMLEEYHTLSRELDGLTVYNDQLQRLLASQEQEQLLIRQQMDDIELTQREIVPLMLRMIERLEEFVIADTPFLRKERLTRVSLLRDIMDRSDVSVTEKYRRVLEAYQIELDYGRTLEAYRDQLETDDTQRTVDFLRVGRIGLYYQTLDGRNAGYWNRQTRSWVPLTAGERLALRRALRVAAQQTAPELLELPIRTAGADHEH